MSDLSPYEELVKMFEENPIIKEFYFTMKKDTEELEMKAWKENPIVFEKLFGYKLKNI